MNPQTGEWITTFAGKKRNDEKYACPWMKEITLPCGKCIGCKLERARQWAVRCMDESRMHADATFVTLTYKDSELLFTKDGHPTIVKEELQKFFRRLRKKTKKKIAYFSCGEYGEKFERPHYHAIIFGWDPGHKKIVQVDPEFGNLYTSPELEELWTKGQSRCGSVTKESAGYVARYTCKKITGENAAKHYDGRTPEFQLQSTKIGPKEDHGGLGYSWLRKHEKDVYLYDQKIVDGHETKPPRYYDKLHARWHPKHMETLKEKRILEMEEQARNNTLRRLEDGETIVEYKIKLLKRRIENGT